MFLNKDILKSIVFIIIISLAILTFTGMLNGCKSYEPIRFKGELEECNDFYSVMKFYAEFDKTPDSAFVGTVYARCQEARVAKRLASRETHCKKLYFKDGYIRSYKFKRAFRREV